MPNPDAEKVLNFATIALKVPQIFPEMEVPGAGVGKG
jgi:hypothetical protein